MNRVTLQLVVVVTALYLHARLSAESPTPNEIRLSDENGTTIIRPGEIVITGPSGSWIRVKTHKRGPAGRAVASPTISMRGGVQRANDHPAEVTMGFMRGGAHIVMAGRSPSAIDKSRDPDAWYEEGSVQTQLMLVARKDAVSIGGHTGPRRVFSLGGKPAGRLILWSEAGEITSEFPSK